MQVIVFMRETAVEFPTTGDDSGSSVQDPSSAASHFMFSMR